VKFVVVRTDFNRFPMARSELLKCIYEGISLKAVTNFKVNRSGTETCENATVTFELASGSFHKKWAKIVHAYTGKECFIRCYTIFRWVTHVLRHQLCPQFLASDAFG